MAQETLQQVGRPVQIPTNKQFGRSGIYFLWREGSVVYIGQSENMRQRIGQHLAEGAKDFDAVSCVPCHSSKLTPLERHFIQALAPEFNRCSIADEARRAKQAGMDLVVNSYTMKFVSPRVAATMLNITLSELGALKQVGIRPIKKRAARTNARYEVYSTADLSAYIQGKHAA